MSGHGPDVDSYEKGLSDPGTPVKFNGGLAFMFETTFILSVSQWAMTHEALQKGYYQCWQGLRKTFE
jgi:homogentisate 1,2-dioxygenase